MTTRMTSRTVVFSRPFVLPGFERIAPAGSYLVETEEEAPEASGTSVWRRLATIIHITHDGTTAYVKINLADLEKALARDQGLESDGAPVESPDEARARLAAARRRNVPQIRRKKF